MATWGDDLNGARMLVVGASSGIGRAVAVAAHGRGARVCVAARRLDRLTQLSKSISGSAYELDVADTAAIENVLHAVGGELGGLDALVYTSAVVPFARIRDIDITTWTHAFAVNAVGASHVMRAAVPYLADDAVAVVTSSHEAGRPRVGVAAYNASKAALDEIWRSWGAEHPSVNVIRVNLGPTSGTEILRGADQDLLDDLNHTWAQQGITSDSASDVVDIAHTLVSLIANARRTPSARTDTVTIVPRPGWDNRV